MNKLYRKFSLLFSAASIVAFVGLTGNVAMASTPDGMTPANEGVCDVLMDGATKGLYGLCVAYCEAQDLDEIGNNKETPNNKILANYRKKMQSGDPDMPCIKTPCPCWSADELAVVAPNVMNCIIFDDFPDTKAAYFITSDPSNPTLLQYAYVSVTAPLCSFTDMVAEPPISLRFSIGDANFPSGVAESCYDQIVAVCP